MKQIINVLGGKTPSIFGHSETERKGYRRKVPEKPKDNVIWGRIRQKKMQLQKSLAWYT